MENEKRESHMKKATCATSETILGPGDRLGFETLQIRDVMQYGVWSIEGNEPVHKAIQLLLDKHISGLPVTEQGRLVGILSEKDVLRLLYERQYLPGIVSDYMNRTVVAFDIEDRFADIYRCLLDSTYRRVPILHRGKLAGLITRADLIRVYRQRFCAPACRPAAARSREDLLARDAMTHGLLTVPKKTSLGEVMDILATQHVTGLPVVDDGMHLEGMITEKDVIRCIGDPESPRSTVERHMTTNLVTFEPTAPLADVCKCLIEQNFRRVPIVSEGRLVGIVARADIIRAMSAVYKLSRTNPN